MISNKKAVHSHIIIIAITSVFLTALLSTVLTSLIANDHIDCKDIQFEIVDQCSEEKAFVVKIKNTHTSKINLYSENNDETYEIPMDETSTVKIISNDDKIKIVPFIKSVMGDEKNYCNSKTIKYDKKNIKKC